MMINELRALTSSQWLLIVLVIFPFLQGLLITVGKFLSQRKLGLLSSIAAFGHFLIAIYLQSLGTDGDTVQLSIPWFPEVFVNFSLRADGLAIFFCLLISGMGSLVFLYAHGYMNHEDPRIRRFYAYLNFFMGSMLGAVLADNMILLFIFWEGTSINSFLLISSEHEKPEARQSSRMAFLINALASLCLLLGFILIGILDQTFELSQIEKIGLIYGERQTWIFSIITLLLIGIYGKSAQFPFHFWLPQAMTAPTPVSAYLHSATMVKLGVYLTARIYVLFVDSELWMPLVTTLSLVTVLVGGVFALFANKLKQVLAYATISQLGFFISFYGMGDPVGLDYDYVHIFNHALYKGSLFMLVGILAHSSGVTDIRHICGIGKKLPLFGFTLIISLAAMAGIPGTTGFLSKELLIADLLLITKSEPAAFPIMLGLLAGLLFKVAFTYRLFYYGFLKKVAKPIQIKKPPAMPLLIPPLTLSATALILGIWPKGLEQLANNLTIEGLHSITPPEIHLWHGFTLALGLSILLFVGGIFLFYFTYRFEKSFSIDNLPCFADAWVRWLDNMPTNAKRLTRVLHSSKPDMSLLWIFVFVTLGLGALFTMEPTKAFYWETPDSINMTSLAMVISVITMLALSNHIHRLILMSVIGFLVMFKFVLKQAPDVAMTQMAIEVGTLFVIVMLFSQVPKAKPSPHSWLRGLLATATGLTVAAIPLFHTSLLQEARLGNFFVESALPLAKGHNTVNTILVDFRGLDTLGEIAVIVVAALGVAGLLLKRETLTVRHFPSLIPTPMLAFMMPSIFIVTTLFGFYLLVRGHNEPGGGFTGGMTPALSIILIAMSMANTRAMMIDRINPFKIMMLGLAFSVAAAALSVPIDGVILASYFSATTPILNTPLLFDAGIFLLVLGSVLAMIYVMRERTLWEQHK